MFTINTLVAIIVVLCVIIIAFIFFCIIGIMSIKEMLNNYIKQNQANQQKLLNRIDKYRIRIDTLESLIEKNQGNKTVPEIVIDEDSKDE